MMLCEVTTGNLSSVVKHLQDNLVNLPKSKHMKDKKVLTTQRTESVMLLFLFKILNQPSELIRTTELLCLCGDEMIHETKKKTSLESMETN